MLSRGTYGIEFSVAEGAIILVRDTVQIFARMHDYTAIKTDDPEGLYCESKWSSFRFYKMSIGEDFIAELSHKDEVIFPRDDLREWLEEFKVSLRQIEGVRSAEGYE